MKLLIDLGNSRLKWALWDGAQLQRGASVAHATAESGGIGEKVDFAALWKDVPAVQAIWVASVASTALEQTLGRTLADHFAVSAHYARSPGSACGVRNAYSAPARLGVDRFLGLVAVHAHAQEATVIASCGTALTLDAIGADGVHLGGLIAPAPALMRNALLDHTARLGELGAAQVVEFADTTSAAVESGTWLAAVALVERFAARTASTLGVTPTVVVTGGGARRLSPLLGVAHCVEPDLVLRGLANFADVEPDA